MVFTNSTGSKLFRCLNTAELFYLYYIAQASDTNTPSLLPGCSTSTCISAKSLTFPVLLPSFFDWFVCLNGHFRAIARLRGGVKKNTGFFWLSVKRGAGGSRPIQKILIRKYSDFFDQGGGSHPIQKGFIRKTEIFWHNLPKKGGFIKKTGIFLTISAKRGGVSANPKNPYQKKLVFFWLFRRKGGGLGQSKKSLSEKTEVVKKGGGGGLSFLTKSHKKPVFFWGLPLP